jgi:hypothetical protein
MPPSTRNENTEGIKKPSTQNLSCYNNVPLTSEIKGEHMNMIQQLSLLALKS